MRLFNNLNIKSKIFFLIGMMVFFILSVGLSGYYYMEKARKELESVYYDRLLAVEWLNEARIYNRNIQVYLSDLLRTHRLKEQEEHIKKIQQAHSFLEKSVVDYKEKTLLADYEKQEYDKLEIILREEEQALRKTLNLQRENKKQEAIKYFNQNSHLFNQSAFFLKKLSVYNKTYAHKIQKQNSQDSLFASKFLLTVIVISVLFSFSVALLIARNIDYSLSTLLKKVKLVSRGMLALENVTLNTKDEFGVLDKAINTMAKDLNNLLVREKFLKELVLSISTSFDMKEIQKKFVTMTGEFFEANRCYFIEYDFKREKFLSVKVYGEYLSDESQLSIVGKPFADEAHYFLRETFNNQDLLYIQDVKKSNLPTEVLDILKIMQVKTSILVPIKYTDLFLGVLIIESTKNQKDYSQGLLEFVKTVANHSAIVFYQANLVNKIQETKDRETTLRTIVNRVLNAENLNQAIEITLEKLSKIFDSDICGFRVYDQKNEVLLNVSEDFVQKQGISADQTKNLFVGKKELKIIKQLFEEKQPFIIDGENVVQTESIFSIKSAIIFPCFYKNEALGLIFIFNTKEKKEWKYEDINFLNLIIPTISACLSSFYLNDKIKKSFIVEKALREIIINIKENMEESKLFGYLSQKLISIFDIDGVMFFELTKGHYFQKSNNLKSLKSNQTEDFSSDFVHFLLDTQDKPLIINDIYSEIKNNKIISYLEGQNIKSFIFYPLNFFKSETMPLEDMIDACLICDSQTKYWSYDDLTYFCFVLDTVNIIYSEIKQRLNLENTRKNFIATLTHDLRSPLLAEQKALEAIIRMEEDVLLKDIVEYLQDIYSTNEDLLRMINNLLSIYHYESGRRELNLAANDITGLINDSIRSLRPLAAARNCEITSEIEKNLPPLMIDGSEIKRVVMNLIGNAIKHTYENTKIKISAKKNQDEIVISINDNGPGIKEEDMPMIFEKYQTQKRKVGSGLGLYLSKQIIEVHGGKIWYESIPGEGATFCFSLPI